MRKLLMYMAVTFIVIDLIFNLIMPTMIATAVLTNKSSSNFQGKMNAWRMSMQLLEDIRV